MLNLNLNTNGGGGGGYVQTQIKINSDQPDTVQLSTDVNVTASIGETSTTSFVSTQSAQPLGRMTARMNSEFEVVLSGSGDWSAIEQEIEFSATETASLITLGIEIPKFDIDITGQTTASIIAIFEETEPYSRFDINQSVKVDNADLFIEFAAVGGGAGGDGGGFSFGGAGGGGGKFVTGSVKLKMNNTATLSAIVGGAGQQFIANNSTPSSNGGNTSVTFVENDGNTINIFVSGGLAAATPYPGGPQNCGLPGGLWLNDLPIGFDGNAGLVPPATPCPSKPTSSLIPAGNIWQNHPGLGGEGGGSCSGNTSCRTNGGTGRGGVFIMKYYNPKGLITFVGTNIYTFTVGDDQYVLMSPGTSTLTFTFPDQVYPKVLQEEVVDFISATGIDDDNTINALNNFVTDLKEYELWDKMEALYPFVGDSETTMKYNFKDPRDTDDAYRIAFSGNWTFSTESGIIPNPTTNKPTSADTHYIRSSVINNISMGYFTTIEKKLGTNQFGIGAVDTNSIYAVGLNDLRVRMGHSAIISSNTTPNTGMVVGQRINQNSIQGYVNGSLRAQTGGHVNLIGWPNGVSVNLSLGGLNAQNMIFAHIGEGLTDKQNADLFAIVNNLQSTLGRI